MEDTNCTTTPSGKLLKDAAPGRSHVVRVLATPVSRPRLSDESVYCYLCV